MDCHGCVQKIKKALHCVNGIYDLQIDLVQQKLTVVGWADPERIIKAIKRTRKIATICSHTQVEDSKPPPKETVAEVNPPAPAPEKGSSSPIDTPTVAEKPPEEPNEEPPPPPSPQVTDNNSPSAAPALEEPNKEPPPSPSPSPSPLALSAAPLGVKLPEEPTKEPPPPPSQSPQVHDTNLTPPAASLEPKDIEAVHIIHHWHDSPNAVTHCYNKYKPSPSISCFVMGYGYPQSPPQYSRLDHYVEDNGCYEHRQHDKGKGDFLCTFAVAVEGKLRAVAGITAWGKL
ncbi:hypothetical protein ACLOJK_017739 [Asimina triloba]